MKISLLFFLMLCLPPSSLYKISKAIDTISPNQSVADGQTLVSKGKFFVLGFFSPHNSQNRYLGIWYKNISPPTVVWVANRENPLRDSSGVLTIGKDGNIVLLNGTKMVIWSSNYSRAIGNPIVKLLDSGNLVLNDEIDGRHGYSIWQSFDHPSDTLLPGMKLGWNLTTGLERYLTSWKYLDDTSPGVFFYRIELHGIIPQVVLRKGSVKQYRSGTWRRHWFRYPWIPNAVFNPIFIFNTDEASYMFEAHDDTVITRFVLNYLGLLQRFVWNNKTDEWILMYEVQKDSCDSYGLCGPNSVCKINDSPSSCECLTGFTPKSQEERNMLDWSGGCTRRTHLDCGKDEGFLKIGRVKLPDLVQFWEYPNISLKECEMQCLKLNNCSCTAYAHSGILGGGYVCILWFGTLIDIRQLIDDDDADQDLYIRLADSELELISESIKKQRRAKVTVIASVVSGMLLFGLIIFCIIWKKKKKTGKSGNESYQKENLELPLFDFVTILNATNNFSSKNKIGEGGFGPVFKGKLSGGQEIAVKRLSYGSGQGVTEFMNETVLIAKLQHRNLVRLLGGCIKGEERMLIYEYMPNKSLDYFIFDPSSRALLDWRKRFHIVMGITQGLLYLHRDSRLRIIHRDVKASNILLDCEMNPKLSDFGAARVFEGDQTKAKTKIIVGTYGYMSPEYATKGLFSMKSDVFSFGVLLLEMVNGMKNREFYHPDHDHNLLGHAWILWKEDKPLELMDPCLKDSCVLDEVLRCIQVGLLCVQNFPEDRPTMTSVRSMLENEDAILPEPKQPGFFTERCSVDICKKESHSKNAVTITLLEAR